MTKILLCGLVLLCLLVTAPMLVALVLVTISGQAAACHVQQTGALTPAGGPAGTIPLAHANVKVSLPDQRLGLTAIQWKRAWQIVAAGKAMSMPQQGIVIALAVASQESGFRVYANDGQGADLAPDQRGIQRSLRRPHDAVGSEHASLGVFQQQWPWWGTMEELMDPGVAATRFYTALLQVPGWQSLPLTVAADRVQQSRYPQAYADDEDLARKVYAELSDTPASDLYRASSQDALCATQMATTDVCPPTGSPAENGLTPDALRVLRCVNAQFGPHTYRGVGTRSSNPDSDHASGRAVDVMIDNRQSANGISEGTAIATWVRRHARALGVTDVIWRAKIWSPGRDSGRWRPYPHPAEDSNPNLLPMNHVHVSVAGNKGTGLIGGTVVFPVPPQVADSDIHNWGESGASWSSWHTGTDFSVACGTPVLAAHAGTVQIDHSQGWAGPSLVKVTTGPGQLTTWYAHMQKVTVSAGQRVQPGQQIGEVGAEGNATGCHLHFEVHLRGGGIYGTDNVDPSTWLADQVRGRAG